MIKSVNVQNFKCLGNLTVSLEPFTVLIGKNDTGKTSFLEAIGILASASPPSNRVRAAFGDNRNVSDFVKHGASPKECRIGAVMTDGSRCEATLSARGFELHVGKNEPVGNPVLEHVQFPYRFDLTKLRAAATVGVLGKQPLPPDGTNFAAAVDRLPNKQFNRLQAELISRLPLIEQLVPETPQGQHGMKEIWFDVKGAGRVPARQMSDGVMLVLALLTVLHDENAPRVVMLEEPETGVHPKQLERLVEAFTAISKQGVQILLSTHSPYLLDFVSKECVRVFTRDEGGDVVVKPLSDLREIRDMMSRGFSLGEAWYNSDEDVIVHNPPNARRTA